jgi:hypothetical protein
MRMSYLQQFAAGSVLVAAVLMACGRTGPGLMDVGAPGPDSVASADDEPGFDGELSSDVQAVSGEPKKCKKEKNPHNKHCVETPDAGPDAGTDAGIDNCSIAQQHASSGGAGAACVDGSTCFSGICESGLCQAGAQGALCTNAGDCISEQCVAGCTCAAGGPFGAGSPCTVNNQCHSGSCTNGVCDQGAAGTQCATPTDCLSLMCTAGICE